MAPTKGNHRQERQLTSDKPASPLRSISWKLLARPCGGASSSAASQAGSLLSTAPPVREDVGSAPLPKLRSIQAHRVKLTQDGMLPCRAEHDVLWWAKHAGARKLGKRA